MNNNKVKKNTFTNNKFGLLSINSDEDNEEIEDKQTNQNYNQNQNQNNDAELDIFRNYYKRGK